MPIPFPLFRAQVVLNLGSPPEVRLNEEVLGRATVTAARDIEKGEVIYEDDITEISWVDLGDSDPNAAHLTVLLWKGTWIVVFDFTYNRGRVNAHLERASEFLEAAARDLAEGRLNSFVDRLLGGTELLAKATLMALPIEKLLSSRKHEFIRGFTTGGRHRRKPRVSIRIS